MNNDLIIEILELGPFFVNTYIVGDAKLKKGFIIDPAWDSRRIIMAVERHGLQIESIVITHGHSDHIVEVDTLRNHFKARVLIGEKDAEMLTNAEDNLSLMAGEAIQVKPSDGILREGDKVSAGRFEFKVLETPGHSPGSISLYHDGVVFTGDALFLGSIGRTDFPNSDYDTLVNSIHQKLLVLPEETIVYAGHGPDTTIGQEKDFNPFI